MIRTRDDFTEKTKDILAKRVAFKCSKPDCSISCTGPNIDSSKYTSIGVAAHITAACKGGPRYNENLSSEERKSVDNGIWLCQTHSRLIDSNPDDFTVSMLKEWKLEAEENARSNLTDENYRLRKEIDRIISTIEGKDSHPVLRFLGYQNKSDFFYELNLANAEANPLYDVWILLHDPEEIKKSFEKGKATLDTYNLYKRINVGNLPPNFHFPIIKPLKKPKKGYFHYFAYIGTRNGIYHQEIYFFPIPNGIPKIKEVLTKHIIGETERKYIIDNRTKKDKNDLEWIIE